LCLGGKWIGHLPTCVPITKRCSSPPRIAYGNFTSTGTERTIDGLTVVNISPYIDGSKVYYYCNNGYRLQNTSLSSLECINGQWLGSVPKCGQ
jgi:hypothetical protein